LITIEIPWEPVPWAAPRLSKYGCYDPREKDKRAIRACVKDQYDDPPMVGYFYILFTFHFAIPKSTSKKRKALMLEGSIRPTKSDCTNLQKLYEDCLKGIVIVDDRYVMSTKSQKYYSESPAVFMHIHQLTPLPCK
jgi:Holliday junction resolvase RusA-like endonuclease